MLKSFEVRWFWRRKHTSQKLEISFNYDIIAEHGQKALPFLSVSFPCYFISELKIWVGM